MNEDKGEIASSCLTALDGKATNRVANPMADYLLRKDKERIGVLSKYQIMGFISSGTYGRVFKAKSRLVNDGKEYAIKKFKPDKEGEAMQYSGISQSACREMALCKELKHENIIRLVETILEDKCIYMVFEYAEHDLLVVAAPIAYRTLIYKSIIHFHSHNERRSIPEQMIRSLLWQLINSVSFLHQNWVIHRDLKPANILVTSKGQVKTGDLGLARLFHEPLQPLFNGDKIVVTIWYRAPELLLGARHYSPAIDMWAIGCIFAELLALRPIFKGEEAKMDNKKQVPFQKNQMQKITEVLGTPTEQTWSGMEQYPEASFMFCFKPSPNQLHLWYKSTGATNQQGLDLLQKLFAWDPIKRISAHEALSHPYFTELPRISLKKVTAEDRDIVKSESSKAANESAKRNVVSSSTHQQNKRVKNAHMASTLHQRPENGVTAFP